MASGDFCLIKNLNIEDVVTLVNVEDGVETALMEVVKELEMVVVGSSWLRAVQQGGLYDGLINAEISTLL